MQFYWVYAYIFVAAYSDNSISKYSMDDNKGRSDHQCSAVNCAAVCDTESGCLATIKVRTQLITNIAMCC